MQWEEKKHRPTRSSWLLAARCCSRLLLPPTGELLQSSKAGFFGIAFLTQEKTFSERISKKRWVGLTRTVLGEKFCHLCSLEYREAVRQHHCNPTSQQKHSSGRVAEKRSLFLCYRLLLPCSTLTFHFDTSVPPLMQWELMHSRAAGRD